MDIRIYHKPTLFQAATKEQLIHSILARYNAHQIFSPAFGNCYVSQHGDKFVAINFQKFNTKRKQIKWRRGSKKEGQTKDYELVRRGKWIANVYLIDTKLPVKVEQGSRFFQISNR